MEFSPELIAFQGVLISADNVHSFSRITAKGGNEEKVKYIVEKLKQFFRDRNLLDGNSNLVTENIQTVRKYMLYIILNGNFNALEGLLENEEIDVVIWTIPTIPHYLICELVWNLKMERFLYEIILYTFPPLGVEVAGAFIENIKYLSPIECSQILKTLSMMCYSYICRVNFYELTENRTNTVLNDASKNLLNCIKYFVEPPNEHKLSSLTKNELYKYKGELLDAALLLLYDCFKEYTGKQDFKTPDFHEIYRLTHVESSIKINHESYNMSECSKKILESLENCNTLLLDMCQKLVMDVSVDIFCAWNEFEENGKTMQQSIGELCHKVYTYLLTINNISEHPVVAMIQQISRKPTDTIDLINSADIQTIQETINSNVDQRESWLHALVYKEGLCQHSELLEIINSNIAVYSQEECSHLYNILKDNKEHIDLTEIVLVKLFHNCSLTVKYEILEIRFSDNFFYDMKENDLFNNMSTEIFNKLIATPAADTTDVLTLFLQNPRKVFEKIYKLASENSQQVEIMLRVVKLFEKYSRHYYDSDTEPTIFKLIHTHLDTFLETEVKQNNFVNFLSNLKRDGFIIGSKLLMLIVMPNIHKGLTKKNIDIIHIQIKLLQNAYSLEELSEYKSPMLAMLAQMLDFARWKFNTFVSISPAVLQNTIELQASLMNLYTNVPEKEENWLRSKLKKIQPLNAYYYRKLWGPPGKNFIEITSGMKLNRNTDREDVITWLMQVVCICTQQEWSVVWDSLSWFEDIDILNMFNQALSLIAMAEKSNRCTNSHACILYCYRNLIHVTRYKFLKEPLTNKQVLGVIRNVAAMPILEHETVEDIEVLLLPLFAYLAERKDDFSLDLSNCNLLKSKGLVNLTRRLFNKNSAPM